jgi:hypothetical protein
MLRSRERQEVFQFIETKRRANELPAQPVTQPISDREWSQPAVEAPGESQVREREPHRERATLPEFPKAAWRGVFADYRAANERATEASDIFHFAALWARCAVALGRRVHFPYGMTLFPNVYLICFGPTGDRKTTATRRGTELGSACKIIAGGGSGEGLADEFSSANPGEGLLVYAEEFSQILRPGRWEGATVLPLLTQCFDCPERYEMKFRKAPVSLERPTPTLLAGTTPDWFWQDFHPRDFQGGFGNRLFFVTGKRKAPIALPARVDVTPISAAVDALCDIRPRELRFEPRAQLLWEQFYSAWNDEESRLEPLLLATVQRIPAYMLKLAMLYAATEKTLPKITCDQLSAAILVGQFGKECASELLTLQNAGTNARKELERCILAYVAACTDENPTKRDVYRTLARHYKDSEEFNRAFDSLVRVGALFTHDAGRNSVLVSTEPFPNNWR